MEVSMQDSSPKDVLVVAPGNDVRGGISSVVRLHARADVWRDMNCQLLSTYDERGKWHKLLAAFKAYFAAPRMVRRSQLVHVHLAGQMSLMRKLPIIALARAMRKPLIVHVHALSQESLFQKTPRWAYRYVLEKADLVIALSNSWAESIRLGTPAAKVSVISNPVVGHTCRVLSDESNRNILFAGKLEPRKGYIELILAAKIIQRECPNVQFWFAGHGEVENADRLICQLGLSSSIRLLGWVEEEDLTKLFRKTSIFCLPSYNEGVPMAVLEAMSHGVPVVCTPVGGLPELIQDGRNGLFAQPGSSASIAEVILKLLRDEDLQKAIGEAGYRTVHQKCGLQNVSNRLTAVYRELLTEAHRSLHG